jgi:hypothetical protein
MSTEQAARRRTAVVLARYDASAAAPEGIDPANFAAACLLDSYEVVADLIGVTSGIAGPAAVAEMLWPGALHLPAEMTVPMIAHQLTFPICQGWCWPSCSRSSTAPTLRSHPNKPGAAARPSVCRCHWPIGFPMTRWTSITIRLSG